MAAGNVHGPSTLAAGQAPAPTSNVASHPTKRDLSKWWDNFKRKAKKEEEKAPVGIFGVPLQVSIKYANVAISLTNDHGQSYIYGYVPIVVAKCGVFLKEKATDVEGIFRLSGSAKRIKELQAIFDSPDRYGKGLDWTGYTVHDAANILRRYLNLLPQPIVPLDFYDRCRDPLRSLQAQSVPVTDAPAAPAADEASFDHAAAIAMYQKLIVELPPLNRQLLLYILDLLAVFSSKSEQNRMTSANLAAIFQPGILSHPSHDMRPDEYRLSQDVLIFLIENQDHFLVGMSGTESDERTLKEVHMGGQAQENTTAKASHAGLGRSASNASGGADSLRKVGALRRNVSVSSRNSNLSSNVPSPGSPAPSSPLAGSISGSGVHRSNTVPSKRSSGLNSPRYAKPSPTDTATPSPSTLAPGVPLPHTAQPSSPSSKLAQTYPEPDPSSGSPTTPTQDPSMGLKPVPEPSSRTASKETPSTENLRLRTPEQVSGNPTVSSAATPTRDRRSLFGKSPPSENERKEPHKPNKLRKRNRPETSNNVSAQSSTHSLHEPDSPSGPFFTPMPTPGVDTHTQNDPMNPSHPTLLNTQATPSTEAPPRLDELDKMSSFHVSHHIPSPGGSPAFKPEQSSPNRSTHSIEEESEVDLAGSGSGEGEKKRKSRWRLSSSGNKIASTSRTTTPAGSRLGSSTVAENSTVSIGSQGKPPKSMTYDSTAAATDTSVPSATVTSSNESTPHKDHSQEKDHGAEDTEKKGLFSRLKAKVTQGKEERKGREAEKVRAKTPPRSEHATSKQSLGGSAQEGLGVRGRSIELSPDAVQEKAEEGVANDA